MGLALGLWAGLAAGGGVACKAPSAPEPAAASASAKAAGAKAAQGTASTAAPTAATRAAPAEATPQGQPPRLPAVARALPTAHTVGLVGVEGLDWAFRMVNTVRGHALEYLPAEVAANLPGPLREERLMLELIDFPPATPSGWQTSGLNPGPGATAVFDARVLAVAPLPLLYLNVRDRGVFMNWLVGLDRRTGGAGHAQATGELHGRCEIVEFAHHRGCIAPRRGFQVVLPLPAELSPEQVKALQSAFSAHIDDAGPALADAPRFGAAFTGYPGRFMGFGYLNTRALADHLAAGEPLPAEAAFYADRFPALSILAGKDLMAVRVLADAAGHTALNQVFGTPHAPKGLAARLPPTAGAYVRLAVAPTTLFTGLAALLPPGAAEARAQVTGLEAALPQLLGASTAELGKALSGQVAILSQVPPGGSSQPDLSQLTLALGLADPAAAEALLTRTLDAAAAAGRLRHDAHTLAGGQPARSVIPGPDSGVPSFFLVQHGDLWLLGLSPDALQVALARPGVAPEAAAALEGPGFFALGVDLAGAFERQGAALLADGGGPALEPKALAALKGLLSGPTGGYTQLALSLDAHGLVLSDARGLTLFGGIVAAIAVPAFVKYTRRARTAQVRMQLHQLRVAAHAYALGDGAAPLAAAPLTPAADPCAAGAPAYQATPETFAHPTWKALGFAPEGQQFYRYAYTPTEGGFELRAVGDLDCDGTQAEFTLKADPNDRGDIEAVNELE